MLTTPAFFLQVVFSLSFAHLQDRHAALEKMGISVETSGIKVECSKYFLVNLNADPSLNELLVYYLKVSTSVCGSWFNFDPYVTFLLLQDHTLIGRRDAPTEQDIQLNGIGIQPQHCIVDIDNSEVFVTPVEGARWGFMAPKTPPCLLEARNISSCDFWIEPEGPYCQMIGAHSRFVSWHSVLMDGWRASNCAPCSALRFSVQWWRWMAPQDLLEVISEMKEAAICGQSENLLLWIDQIPGKCWLRFMYSA